MRKNLFLILLLILTNCSSSDDSSTEPQNLNNLPIVIENDGTAFARLFKYENTRLVGTDRTSIQPYQISQEDVFHYDSSNRLEKLTDFFDQDLIFDLVYDNSNRITSYKNSGTTHTNRIDLSYNGNSITYSIYTKEYNSDVYELSHTQIYTLNNGNITKIEIPDQSITEYFYDQNNSPFSNINEFENFQTIFSNFGVVSSPEIYWIKDLFLGKNNLIRQEYTYLVTGEITITEYQSNYNTSNYPSNINSLIIEYN